MWSTAFCLGTFLILVWKALCCHSAMCLWRVSVSRSPSVIIHCSSILGSGNFRSSLACFFLIGTPFLSTGHHCFLWACHVICTVLLQVQSRQGISNLPPTFGQRTTSIKSHKWLIFRLRLPVLWHEWFNESSLSLIFGQNSNLYEYNFWWEAVLVNLGHKL